MAKSPKSELILSISAPDLRVVGMQIIGTTPYCQNRFSEKAKQQMRDAQEAGSAGKTRKKQEPKDFDAAFRAAIHRCEEGDWNGIPCSAFRSAMISACRVAGIVMTKAKLAVYVLPDGFDTQDNDPLVRITHGEPHRVDSMVRIQGKTSDIRPRPVWDAGWQAFVQIEYDNGVLHADDVCNLLTRAGKQVGIGEGRNDSRNSAGCGWGRFVVDADSIDDYTELHLAAGGSA